MEKNTDLQSVKNTIITLGIGLISVGFITIVELNIHTGWLFVFLPLLICSFVFYLGWKLQNKFLLAAGSLIFIIGFSSLFIFSNLSSGEKFGVTSLVLSFGITLFLVTNYLVFKRIAFWYFNPIIVIISLGIIFLQGDYSFLHFTFYLGLGIGIALFGSGLYWRLFGLIIPGCLLIGISPGLFFAWGNSNIDNGLPNE